MARHLMAVCVVCLFYVDHIPCQEHFDNVLFPKLMHINNNYNNEKYYDNKHNQNNHINGNYKNLNNFQIPIDNNNNNKKINKNYATDSIVDVTLATTNTYLNNNAQQQLQQRNSKYQEKSSSNNGNYIKTVNSNQIISKYSNDNLNNIGLRSKRHANHNHNEDINSLSSTNMPKITQKYLQQLFDEYGANDGTISLSSFQRMLRQLGLIQLIEQQPQQQQQQQQQQEKELYEKSTITTIEKFNTTNTTSNVQNETCITETSLLHLIQKHQAVPHGGRATMKHDHALENEHDLNQQDLLHMCPVLLYQLSSPNEALRTGCIETDIVEHLIEDDDAQKKQNLVKVWIYAFVAVLACSILGLVGVAIIPFMDSHYYKHIIHFLVALAVGTMTGDALLHLLPHSLAGQSETNMIYKGLVCMSGIIFFYITEHGLTMISEWRKCKAKQEINNSKWQVAKVMREPDRATTVSGTSVAGSGGDKVCKSKYSSYPYCYDEIAMDMLHDVWLHLPKNAVGSNVNATNNAYDATDMNRMQSDDDILYERSRRNGKKSTTSIVSGNDPAEIAAVQSLLQHNTENQPPQINHNCHCKHNKNIRNTISSSTYNPHHLPQTEQVDTEWKELNMQIGDNIAVNGVESNHDMSANIDTDAVINHCDCNCNCHNCDDAVKSAHSADEVLPNHLNNAAAGSNVAIMPLSAQRENEPVTVILREHEATHHGHSHKHGHVHSPPESLSAVAWMIIMGDGLHNFTDGMAIGAAFAENIAGGFSTALAVFCHELPHELGDFAILMKAGMSVKSAVYYNLLTGVLSFIGMIFGIVFGQSQETAQWMFAAAAGLFIYIALVDMMPEISAAHKSIYEFVLQILGISTGVALMLLIAIFEGDLMNVFPAQ